MLKRPEDKRLHLVLGSPWKEALGSLSPGGSDSTKDVWLYDVPIDAGDLLLSALDTQPRMFVCLETTSAAVTSPSSYLPIDIFHLFPQLVDARALRSRLGRHRLPTSPGPIDNELADALLQAVADELASPTALSFPEGRRVRTTNRERSEALQASALLQSGGTCAGCDRDFRSMLDGRGMTALDVHHVQPFAEDEADDERESTLADVIVVCGACHRLLHATGNPSLQDVRYAWRPACPACGTHAAQPLLWASPAFLCRSTSSSPAA